MQSEIKFDFSNMLFENVGSHGITQSEIETNNKIAEKILDKVKNNPSKEEIAYFENIRNPADLEEIQKFADEIANNFKNFVVLGIGGSALGARALFAGLTSMDYNRDKNERNGRPRVFIRDSIDPEKFASLLEIVDVKDTMFCVVTKSGGTTETMIQLSVVLKKVKENVEDFSKHFCVITSSKESVLNVWATENKIKTFYFSQNLSGRFSVLSAVGLLPAAVCGIDIKQILNGAKTMLEKCLQKDSPALYGAMLQKIAIEKGVNISYLMPYADSLRVFTEWYCQLWAESLGKHKTENGKDIFVGQTPVRAFGTVDQHSQMQLCLDGPFDKVVSFVKVLKFKKDLVIPSEILVPEFIRGRQMAEILIKSQEATSMALARQGRMNRTFILDEVCEYQMGELMAYFMLETTFTGAFFGIDTYDQPSVELIKQNIKAMLKKE